LSDQQTHGINWQLSQASFERFLAVLDADRHAAAERYELLRSKLTSFFEWRGSRAPEEHADVVINRVIKKVEQGEEVRDPHSYCYGVARLVLLEEQKRDVRAQAAHHEFHRVLPAAEDASDLEGRVRCLRRCLGELLPGQRELIQKYYGEEGARRIDGRRRLAEALGIGMNALRIRAFRLTDRLQSCVTGCVARTQA
jgi:DNA-directed RNA polymerase specialized sigma24 family protein